LKSKRKGGSQASFFSFLDYVFLGMSLMVLTQSVDSRGPYFFKKLKKFIKGDIGGLIFL